jgi:hypothetical protein
MEHTFREFQERPAAIANMYVLTTTFDVVIAKCT